MKSVIVAISLTTNLFMGIAVYSFCSGKVERVQADYLTAVSENYVPARPVKLARQ